VDLHPTTSFQFSEDQQYLLCTDKYNQRLLLNTIKCRIEDTLCMPYNIQSILIAEPRITNILAYNRLARQDAITQQQLGQANTVYILNAAFSPSCASFFAICATATPGQYALQEIDAETLKHIPASTAHLPPISILGSNEDIARGYLKSVGDSLLYFRHDGIVMRWKVEGF